MLDENGVDVAKLNTRQKSLYKTWKDTDGAFDLDTVLAAASTHHPEERESRRREAELVLATLHGRNTGIKRACLKCGHDFIADYLYVRYCGDNCLKTAIEEDLGLDWDPQKTAAERWQNLPPSIIKPDTLHELEKWAHKIIDWRVDAIA